MHIVFFNAFIIESLCVLRGKVRFHSYPVLFSQSHIVLAPMTCYTANNLCVGILIKVFKLLPLLAVWFSLFTVGIMSNISSEKFLNKTLSDFARKSVFM